MKPFNQEEYLKERTRQRVTGWGALLTSIPVIIDIPFPPLPPHLNIGLAAVLLVVSWLFLYRGYSLRYLVPQVGRVAAKDEYKGFLTIPLLAMELDIDLEQSKAILEALEQAGYVSMEEYGEIVGEGVYRYGGVLPDPERMGEVHRLSREVLDKLIDEYPAGEKEWLEGEGKETGEERD